MNKSIQKVIAVFALAAILLALPGTLMAQTVAVSGRCITGTITLTVDPGSPLNGKVWYSGTGTVLGFPGVIVNIYWDNGVNRWYLDFDGQAYFENADNTTLPPSTNSGTWVPTVDNTDCITGAPLSITGSGTGDREINLKQSTTNLADGGSFNFGNVSLGSNSSLVFTIENTGTLSLNLTGTPPNYVVKGGTNPGDFTITQPATGTINAGSSTTFTVVFAPGGPGARSCTLQIANNDGDENPYDLTLNGTGTCATITFGTSVTNTCQGGSGGQIVVNGVTGGSGPYTYSKDNGANYQPDATFTGLAANTYQVVVKDNNGCTSGATPVVVGSNPLPSVFNVTGGGGYCSGGTGVAVGLSGSESGVNYTLFRGATQVTVVAGTGSTIPFGLQTVAGTYTVTATNATTNCQNNMSGSAVVTVNALPSCLITFNNPPPWGFDTTCANSVGNLYSATAGMASYSWAVSGSGTIVGSNTGSSVSITAGPTGSYNTSVTLTNANGCVSNCIKSTPIKSSPTCVLSGPSSVPCNSTGNVYSVSNGSFTISSYNWSISGDGVITSATNGSSVTVTAGASGSFNISVTSTGFNACPSFCSQSVTVQTCAIDFSGKIIFSNDNGLGVKNAILTLGGSGTGSDTSDVNGNYDIPTLYSSGNFTLTPNKTANKLNGVTVGDATVIQQHVANITPITDLYKLVAADVNKSSSITSVDASIINQSLLGNPSALTQFKTSWRFVPTSHTMTNPPWGFPEQRTYTNISANQSNQDFYGIKTGDVTSLFANPSNLDAIPNLVLRAQNQIVQPGQAIAVQFRADQLDDLAAFQLGLSFDPALLQFVEIQPDTSLPLAVDNFGTYNADSGEIRVAWSQPTGVVLNEAAPLFRFLFNVLQPDVKLSEALHLDESMLPALAYNAAVQESKVQLIFSELTGTGDPANTNGVQLFQNRPNPFNGTTGIAFVLPQALEAQLRVYDVSGRLLWERKGNYPAGRSEVIFEANGAAGILYYELTTSFGVVSRKMSALR